MPRVPASIQVTNRHFQHVADQLTLESAVEAVPYQRHSETSREAAESLAGGVARSHEKMVLEYLRTLRGLGTRGATDLEIDAYFRTAGVKFTTMRPRRIKLVQQGLVVETGETRPTPTGRRATVWTAA